MNIGTALLLVLAVAFYLLPTAISGIRKTEHQTGIFVVNLVFGWTVLGWIAALIWACMEKPTLAPAKKLEWSDEPIPRDLSRAEFEARRKNPEAFK